MERLQSVGKAQPVQMAGLYHSHGTSELHVLYLTIDHSGTVNPRQSKPHESEWLMPHPRLKVKLTLCICLKRIESEMELSNTVNMEA